MLYYIMLISKQRAGIKDSQDSIQSDFTHMAYLT